jgi:hypothetical protein
MNDSGANARPIEQTMLLDIDKRVRDIERKLDNGINEHMRRTDDMLEKQQSILESLADNLNAHINSSGLELKGCQDDIVELQGRRARTAQWVMGIVTGVMSITAVISTLSATGVIL